MRILKKACAVVVNNLNQVLAYSCSSTHSQVEEKMKEIMGADGWNKAKKIGCRVVDAEITAFLK